VADDRGGPQAARAQYCGQADLDGEDHRLDAVGAAQFAGADHLARGEAGLLSEHRIDLVDGLGEHRFGDQQAAAHPRPLGAVAGEDPHGVVGGSCGDGLVVALRPGGQALQCGQ